jgi:hypothetical protein
VARVSAQVVLLLLAGVGPLGRDVFFQTQGWWQFPGCAACLCEAWKAWALPLQGTPGVQPRKQGIIHSILPLILLPCTDGSGPAEAGSPDLPDRV